MYRMEIADEDCVSGDAEAADGNGL